MPVSGAWLTPFQPNSEVVVLPSTTAPASRRRVTNGVSAPNTSPFMVIEPRWVGKSAVTAKSLMVTGMPVSGPTFWPLVSACSAARAWSMAASPSHTTKAFN